MSMLMDAIFVLLLVACARAGVVEDSGLDLDMHIHTTGPNCWATGEMDIKYLTTIPGAPSPPEALAMTVDQISSHIGLPKFVNMSETAFSCVDGRYPASIITTAGGDAAEFMLALRILNNQYGLPMNQYVVSTIFRNYMSTMAKDEPLRQFYMHTDLHAWQHLTSSLNLTQDFDIHNPPDILKDDLIRALVQPNNIGCGHIKNMMKSPVDYQMSTDVMRYFIRAFFEYMWLEDAARTISARKLLFVILTGDHAESAIMSVSFKGCVNSLAPAIRSETPESSYFIHHNDASQTLRTNMARYFNQNFPTYVTDPVDFVGKMNAAYAVQLDQTLSRLAKGLPVYSVLITGWELSLGQSVAGAFIASFIAFIMIGAIGYAVHRQIVASNSIIILTETITQAVNRVVWRWIKIMSPFFLLICLIFWTFFDLRIMTSIAFSTFTPSVAALLVFRYSPYATSRICAASLVSMQSGAQVALQSGVVIALLSVAPIFLWLGIVCYMFSLEDRSVLTFGFGLALVNLTVRVGGSIFSKSVQQADETERHRRQTEALHQQQMNAEEAGNSVAPLANQLTGKDGSKVSQLLHLIGRCVDDIMGTSIDLADSLVSALISSLYVGVAIYGDDGLALPLWIMSVGLFCSMFAVSLVAFMARCCGRDSELMQFSTERLGFDLSVGAMTQQKIMRILRFGYFLTSAMYLGLSALAVKLLNMDSNMYYCVVIGHIGGYILSIISELATSKESLSSMLATVISVLPGGDVNLDDPNALSSADLESQSSSSSIPGLSAIKSFVSSAMVAAVIKLRQGARLVSQNALSKLIEPIGSGVLKALIVGMSSSLAPILIIFGILLSCGNLGGTWGITMAGVSMLSTCVMPIAFCAMSPLLSSAATLFIISEHPEEVIEEANAMTWIGDTAANSVKGFTTGAASLVSFCLFFTFTQTAGVSSVDLMTDPEVLPGIMLGSVMPNVFAALTLSTLSVVSQTLASHTPKSVADEADAGVMQGSAASYLSNLADTGLTCAMWHLMVPAAFAISLTEIIAFFFNTQVLAGFLAGAIVSGLVMANMLATTGASMDSSSNSNAFGASLKDAGGPSINVMTKLICLVAIINTTKSWALFALVIATAIIIASVFALNMYRTGKASFDPVIMQEEMDRVRMRATSMIVKPFGTNSDSFQASNIETAETTDVVVETANVMKDVSQVQVPPKESDRDDELDLK